MSDSENHHHGKNEIVIVKRHGGGDHDGHHGGAWKIAYADFMTAMMAFFLVMWLVNAANEETKASVASYFNPIKLSDEKPSEKGLKKPVDQADGQRKQERSKQDAEEQANGASAATGEDQTATSGDQTNYSEADFFENPYSVLAEIAQQVGQQANVSAKGEGGAADSGPSTGAEGGEAYRDPFDPDFWTQQVQNIEGQPGPKSAQLQPAGSDTDVQQDPQEQMDIALSGQRPKAADQLQIVPQQAAEPEQADAGQLDAETADAEHASDGEAAKPAEIALAFPDQPDAADIEQARAAAELRKSIEQELDGISGKLADGLVVTMAEGGVLITLSDQLEAPMFNVGSAVPRPEMVLAMEKIGALLAERQGSVVIRGHTDGRPFRNTSKDNWTLSMDRAHSAYYMLVRGGLQENRIVQVSGFADRQLQVPDDPLADANRRIEILLQVEPASTPDRG